MIAARGALLVGLAALGACSGQSSRSNVGQAGTLPNQLMADNSLATGVPGNRMAAPTTAPAAPIPVHAAQYVMVAGADDLFEHQASTLALTKSTDPQIRAFAQRMVTDHTKTTQALNAAAAQAGVPVPPPQLTPGQQQYISELQPLSGSAFDHAYLAQQVAAHRAALALHQNYARHGDNAVLKQAAAKTVPIIEAHLTRVQQLAG